MGAVHENDTSTSVKAMRNIEISPLVLAAFVSTAFAHLSGSFNSNHPKNDNANTTSSSAKNTLNTAFVDKALSVSEPNRAVTSNPNVR